MAAEIGIGALSGLNRGIGLTRRWTAIVSSASRRLESGRSALMRWVVGMSMHEDFDVGLARRTGARI